MATLTACAGSCPTAPPLAWPRRILAQSQPKNTKSRRSKRPLLDRAPTYAPPTWQSRSRYRFAPSQAHLSSWPNPHRSRGTAAAHIPRFRALALFGRRALERVDSPAIPASENLHNRRHRAVSFLDHLVGELLQLQGYLNAKRLGGREVDNQIELLWPLYRKVIWLGPV